MVLASNTRVFNDVPESQIQQRLLREMVERSIPASSEDGDQEDCSQASLESLEA